MKAAAIAGSAGTVMILGTSHTPEEERLMHGIGLRGQAGFRKDDGTTLVPPWFAPVFLVCAAVLVPWTVLLFLTLPPRYGAHHWHLAWSGFDLALVLALATTAVTIMRRSAFGELAATVTGTLLLCDAWFDVLTSHGTADVVQAAASALLIELPLACLCFWAARNLARAMEDVRPHLQAAGFRIEGGKLVPPAKYNDRGGD